MYYLHIRTAGLLGRDDYSDREVWQREAHQSLADGATFVLMHEGESALRVVDVAPLAASGLPVGIYLSESARLAIDAALLGPVDFVASISTQPLYRLRHTEFMDSAAKASTDAVTSAPVEVPFSDAQEPEIKRARGRPRKNSNPPTANPESPRQPLDLSEAYPSSQEFFANILDEKKSPGLAALNAYLGFGQQQKSVVELAAEAGIGRAGMDLRLKKIGKEHRQTPEVAALISRLMRLLAEAREPIFAAGIPSKDSWFRPEDVLRPGFADYLFLISSGDIDSLETANGTVLCTVPKKLWKNSAARLREWLVELEGRGAAVPVEVFDAKVREFLPEALPDTFASLLIESVDDGRLYRARLPTGEDVVSGYGIGVRPMVRTLLLESEHALHFDEILRQLKARFELDQAEASVRNAVIECALPFERSTYGLRHHIGLSEKDLLEIIGAAEEAASTAPDRQWTADEIAGALSDKEHLTGFSITARRINLVLKAGPTVLHDHGRGVWSLDGTVPRRQIHDIVVDALVRCGRPMTNEELREEIEKSRGTGETFQIQPRENLIQVARATWGLVERDLAISEAEAKEWLKALIDVVAAAGHGIHIDEVPEVLAARGRNVADLGDVTILSALARRFGGLAITRSRYFILPDWSDERRITPRQAVESVVLANPEKTSGQLAEIVSEICGRTVDKGHVLNVLGDLGYIFNPETGGWT